MAELHPMRVLEYIKVSQASPDVKNYRPISEFLSFRLSDSDNLMSFRKFSNFRCLVIFRTWIQNANSYWSRTIRTITEHRLFTVSKFFHDNESLNSSRGRLADVYQSKWHKNVAIIRPKNNRVGVVWVKYEPTALFGFELVPSTQPQHKGQSGIEESSPESSPRSPLNRLLYASLALLIGLSLSYFLICKSDLDSTPLFLLLLLLAFICGACGLALLLDTLADSGQLFRNAHELSNLICDPDKSLGVIHIVC